MNDCIFCKIINGEIPSKKVFEDDDFICFHDIHPTASTHVLLVPKTHIESINNLTDTNFSGKLLTKVPEIAKILGIGQAYKAIINTGADAGQSVAHMHIHILGGKFFGLPH
jgi:histidine triad (HIT) family protein